ncbi:MAG: class I SAM-dependent methyltransferase [bacterium]|nr:class I SAM-dependent methyltransferase [bacterium]
MTTLSRAEAKRAYDRLGKKLDALPYYEDRATDELARCGSFDAAHNVFEFGCGTGRFAARLLGHHLPDTTHYRAVDQSTTMVRVAGENLEPFGERVQIEQTDGSPPCDEPSASFDRFVSTFVFDLLCEEDIASVLEQAHRMLSPSGLLCLASLSTGSTPMSRLSARVWAAVHRVRPSLVLGCRPIELTPYLCESAWTITHHVQLTPLGLPAEVIVAERR